MLIGAFVTPMKLSRRCLGLWREVLDRVPGARLVFSPTRPAFRGSYLRLTAAAGIAADRLYFLPQGRDDAENQARYELIDFVLDPMPYGGVNGTLEALDMGVPVVTLVGRRHGERTSLSILANLGVPQTVAQGGREYRGHRRPPRHRSRVHARCARGDPARTRRAPRSPMPSATRATSRRPIARRCDRRRRRLCAMRERAAPDAMPR